MNLPQTLRALFRSQAAERDDRLAGMQLEGSRLAPLTVTSPAFQPGGRLPVRHTQDGENVSPPLRWKGIGPEVKSLALIVEDPDAPTPEPFVHWLAANLPARTPGLESAIPARGADIAVQGQHSMKRVGYLGSAPPRGDDPHHYHFQLFGLDTQLDLEPGFSRDALLDAMEGHVIAFGELVGTYQRP